MSFIKILKSDFVAICMALALRQSYLLWLLLYLYIFEVNSLYSLIFFILLFYVEEEIFNLRHAVTEITKCYTNLINAIIVNKRNKANVPPKPNLSLSLTAKPDPYETADPTTQAKLTLRRDLFSNESGKILFYALLVALEGYCEPPINGSWNITKGWPNTHNWKWENTSYQVTPAWWNPFTENLTNALQVSYTLGDGTCDDDNKYCNKPLKTNTKYALKVRGFTNSGFQDTVVIYFQTLDKLPLIKIVSILGGLFLVTVAGVCLSIFDFGRVKRVSLLPCHKTKDSFSPVPEALSQKSFLKYAQELIDTPGRLGNEFHLLGTLSSDVSTLCLHAQRVDNRSKNRYGNILPFDMTRVKLSIIDDDPSTDYINANFIKGFKQQIQYIACQGPKEETCHDFYRMIMEQNIELIVMLTDLTEYGCDKCFKYYPEKDEVIKLKDFTIACLKTEELETYTKRVLSISTSGRSLEVTQLHFQKWRDFECPEDPEIMLKFCDLVNKHSTKGCTLVHCSAGAGRTGTFIAIDILLHKIKTNNKISVFNTVLELRQQRVNMVSTETQLGYIYKCVSRAIEGDSLRTKEIV